MNEIIANFISTYGIQIIMTILTAIVTFLGNKIKTIYENKVQDETKKKVVEDTCKYIEQVFKDLKGEDKLKLAIENATEMLNNKGITITELELTVMIESVCNDFKKAVRIDENIAEITETIAE